MKNVALAIATAGLVAASGTALAEPVAEFDGLVSHCQEAFADRPMSEVAYAPAANSWVKRMYAPTSVVPTLHRTSSIISPYVAQIAVTELAAARRGDDEATARALNVSLDENVVRSIKRIHLSYQHETWVVIGGTSVVEVKRDVDDSFSIADSSRLSHDAVMDLTGPMAVCLDGLRH